MNPKAYYWIDIETTGLDPNDDAILEIAIARAPFSEPFNIKPLVEIVLRFEDWTDVDSYVKEMHFKSGLMLDCMHSTKVIDKDTIENGHVLSNPDITGVDALTLLHHKIIATHPSDWAPSLLAHEIRRDMKSDELPVLAGSSVHFDHSFLKVDFPTFAKCFSHRFLDVSALKLFCRSMGMEIQQKKEAHRAMADIMESARHAEECFEWLAHNHIDEILTRWKIPPPF